MPAEINNVHCRMPSMSSLPMITLADVLNGSSNSDMHVIRSTRHAPL